MHDPRVVRVRRRNAPAVEAGGVARVQERLQHRGMCLPQRRHALPPQREAGAGPGGRGGLGLEHAEALAQELGGDLQPRLCI